MEKTPPVIVWFRQDLRLADNPALCAAAKTDAPIVPIYIHDDQVAGRWAMGAASRWWLHQSLRALNDQLDGKLNSFSGSAERIIAELLKETGATAVYWNRCYEPWCIARDSSLKQTLSDSGAKVRTFNGSLLFEPQNVKKSDGWPYKVFTPFYRKGCLERGPNPRLPLPVPKGLKLVEFADRPTLESLNLLPRVRWYDSMEQCWQPGEAGASKRLQKFLHSGLSNYKEGRNRPDLPLVSRLSPHLHFGEISPNQAWYAAKSRGDDTSMTHDVDHFLSELGWREFSNNLLYYWPELPQENLQRKFNRFPWREDREQLARWQRGTSGYPVVDAGMRELWQTGYMHNRVRMVAGSFLVKNLMLHWHHGAEWFWDTLVDADLANNSASWQWIAGSGADAAPYFRIFNPVTQGQKFDPNGDYVRKYVPELAGLPSKHIHSPWTAPAEVLADAGVKLGDNYPLPIVELKQSRERALQAFRSLGSGSPPLESRAATAL